MCVLLLRYQVPKLFSAGEGWGSSDVFFSTISERKIMSVVFSPLSLCHVTAIKDIRHL